MAKERSLFKNESFYEVLFFLTALACMLAFVLIQPFGEGPDEINRFRIVWYISEHGILPKGDDPEVLIPGYGGSYAFQPMLPYMIQGYLLWFLRLFTERFDMLLVSARMVNVLFGLGCAYYARKLSKLFFPDTLSQWIFSCLVVFLPQSIFIHTYVNTDSCALFSVMMMFAAALTGCRKGFGRSQYIQLAVGIVLCMLSYYNAYGAILVSAVLFLTHFVNKVPAGSITADGTASPKDRYYIEFRPLLRKGCFIALLVLIGAGWWFLRNAILYQGDFLGMQARNQCVALTCTPEFHPLLRPTYQNQGVGVLEMVFGTDFFTLLSRSFVAMFGPMIIPTHYYIYETYYRIFAAGLVAALIPVGHELYLNWQSTRHKWLINICMGIACIIPIVLCVYYSYSWDFQPQGRYLLPMLPAFMYLVTLGIKKILFLLQALSDKLHLRTFTPILPKLFGGLLLFFITAALLYSVFAVMVPHYL